MVNGNYDLSANRFKELKHFCLQYYEFKDILRRASDRVLSDGKCDPVPGCAITITAYEKAIQLIEKTAYDTSVAYHEYILRSVVDDVSMSRLEVPLEKGDFDDLRHKFFWLLSERKGVM